MSFVDIRLGVLPTNPSLSDRYAGLLDQQELDKAETFNNPLMRSQYIAVRGLLRSILAEYLPAKPGDLQFTYGEYGKPALLGHDLNFNLSHTSGKLAIAVSDLKHIGVDIEEIRSRKALSELAKRCFSTREFSAWNCLPASQQLQTFYRLWTKKEAFVKAVGRGIALGLVQCEIDMQSGLDFVNIPQGYGQAQDWKIIELAAEPGFCGALVVPNVIFTLRQYRLDVENDALPEPLGDKIKPAA